MTMPTLAPEVELSLKHWYFWLTNQEAVRLIGHIPYTRVYGQLKSWQLLPEEAKVLLLNEWRRTTAKS